MISNLLLAHIVVVDVSGAAKKGKQLKKNNNKKSLFDSLQNSLEDGIAIIERRVLKNKQKERKNKQK